MIGMFLFILVFLLFIFIGVPVAFAMLGSSIIFFQIYYPGELIAIPQTLLLGVNSFSLIAVPLFIFVGVLMEKSNMIEYLIELSRYLVGRLVGGLAHINIVASMLFAGISGTATADVSALGSILIPTMVKEKFSASYSAAVTAASSTIGPIIPPSVIMVALGAVVGISVGRLFLGGIIPGVLVGLFMMVINHVISARRGYGRVKVNWNIKSFIRTLIKAVGPFTITAIIIIGIVGGIFTPSEAADIAVVVAIILGLIVYRRLTFKNLWQATLQTLYLIGPIMFLISAANAFSGLLILQEAGIVVANTLLVISNNQKIILLIISLVVLFLGCFMEALAIMFLIAPVLMPVIINLGINPIHFGLVFVQALMIGLITPPMGISMYIASDIAQINIKDFIKEVSPFFLVLLFVLFISIFFPEIVLYIPNLIMPIRLR